MELPNVKAKKWPDAEKVNTLLGEHLRSMRERAGVNQGDVAEALGVARTLAGKLERGATGWRLKHIIAAAELFGVSPVEFFAAAFDEPAPVRGAIDLTDAEAGLVFTLRSQGPALAMQLLLNQIKQQLDGPR